MKVLVFEFITGGGFADRELPESLAREGEMMLQALLAELKTLESVKPIVMMDSRCVKQELSADIETRIIAGGQDYLSILKRLLSECDVFWPIAPETDGQLTALYDLAEAKGVRTLLSSRKALALCQSKLACSRHLQEYGVDAIETYSFDLHEYTRESSWVIKPDDGVGCEGSRLVNSGEDYSMLKRTLDATSFVVQPYLDGRALSLSCLCKNGQAWLLSCNEQDVEIENGEFHLQACRVNIPNASEYDYHGLINQIAQAIPELWGYIGIDLIETEQGPVVLEINPRLTTSYVGICSATGVNVAEQVLLMLGSEPKPDKPRDQVVNVNFTEGLY